MNSDQLHMVFIKEYGFKPWPKSYKVDAETYGNVCQAIIDNIIKQREKYYLNTDEDLRTIWIALGPENGIMFKGVELILDAKKDFKWDEGP